MFPCFSVTDFFAKSNHVGFSRKTNRYAKALVFKQNKIIENVGQRKVQASVALLTDMETFFVLHVIL